MTLAVYHEGAAYPALEAWARSGDSVFKVGVRKLANWLRLQRNPRTLDYMTKLAREHFPSLDTIVSVPPAGQPPDIDWASHDEIVLLWADSNGMGWNRLEAECRRRHRPGARMWVVTGRRRKVEFDSAIFRKLKRRGSVEASLALPLVMTILILTTAPVLWAFDFVRGRR